MLTAAAVAGGGALLAPAPAGAKTLTQLQQGLAFYRGKTILLICAGSPGALYDLNCRDIQAPVEAYLHATVNIEDISAGNGVPAQNTTNSSNPDGLTFGELNSVNDISQAITHQAGLNFNPERVAFIGAAGPDVSALLAAPSSPFTSFSALVHSSSPVTILDLTNGAGNVRIRTMIGVFGINARLITGYANDGALLAGFERGDGEVSDEILSSATPLVQAGKARALLMSSSIPVGFPGANYFRGVPTLDQYGKAHPPKSRRQQKALAALIDITDVLNAPEFFAPTAIPPARLAALRAAVKFAELSPSVRAIKLAQGLKPGYTSGPAAKAAYVQAINDGNLVASYLSS